MKTDNFDFSDAINGARLHAFSSMTGTRLVVTRNNRCYDAGLT